MAMSIKTESTTSGGAVPNAGGGGGGGNNGAFGRCQCCFRETSPFDRFPTWYNYESFIQTIFVCYSIKIPPRYNLKCVICDYCIRRLWEAHQFRCSILDSQEKFTHYEFPDNSQPFYPASKSEDFNRTDTDAHKSVFPEGNIPESSEGFAVSYVTVKASYSDTSDNEQGFPGMENAIKKSTLSKDAQKRESSCEKQLSDSQDIDSDDKTISEYQKECRAKKSARKIRKKCKDVRVNVLKIDKYLDGKSSVDVQEQDIMSNISKGSDSIKRKFIDAEKLEEKALKCPVCDKVVYKFKLRHLLSHIDNEQPDENNLIMCPICNKKTKFDTVRAHLKNHLFKRLRVFMCEHCDERFSTLYFYEKHKHDAHGTATHECTMCSKKFYTSKLLNQHIRQTHERTINFTCEYCGEQFTDKCLLVRHIKVHHMKPTLQCPSCPRMFAITSRLNEHIKKHECTESFKCTLCPKVLANERNLQIHMEYHGTPKFKCSICMKGFFNQLALRLHMVIHNTIKKYSCEFCGKRFHTRKDLTKHTKIHLFTTKDYECTICSTKFLQKTYLRIHMRNAHEQIRDVKCSICPRAFRTEDDLQVHMRFHNDERNFKCNMCPKKFHRQQNLNKHLLTHNKGERTHKCTLCEKSFFLSRDLNFHLKRHKKWAMEKEQKTKC